MKICHECGGNHEPLGSHSYCITHWKRRALEAENACLASRVFGVPAIIKPYLEWQTFPWSTVPSWCPAWGDIQGKAKFYKTAKLRSNGECVAIRLLQPDCFGIAGGRVANAGELCDFCL